MSRSETATTATVVGLSLFSGLDGDALMGAFAGGALYAMKSDEISTGKRLGYMIISIIAGYYFRNELEKIGITSTAASSFIFAAFAIAIVSWGYNQIDTLKLSDIWRVKK